MKKEREIFRNIALFVLQQDCPNGRLTPAKFVDMYKMFFPSGNAEEFCDHVFRTFDMDKNGYIDFKVRRPDSSTRFFLYIHHRQSTETTEIYVRVYIFVYLFLSNENTRKFAYNKEQKNIQFRAFELNRFETNFEIAFVSFYNRAVKTIVVIYDLNEQIIDYRKVTRLLMINIDVSIG